ncbi:receptor-like protein kinase [Gossypium australe]|uniref:Receptor-like protein kinase n=1 Tax=Gossypium australe TaxID=47621 RepID=A0A5B6V9N5_9ROSI|nr:receptor-like protein kinase [Gossypium australe]
MLRQYRPDPSHVISPKEVEIRPDMTYGDEPIKILAQEVIPQQTGIKDSLIFVINTFRDGRVKV